MRRPWVPLVLLGLGLLPILVLWSRGDVEHAQGRILDSRFDPTTMNGEMHEQIQFRYTVDDTQFTSPWIEQDSGPFNPTEFILRHQPGQPLTVWYHPLLPSYPSLSRVTLWYPVAALLLGGLLMLAGLISLSRALLTR